jgi:hypothetical protein
VHHSKTLNPNIENRSNAVLLWFLPVVDDITIIYVTMSPGHCPILDITTGLDATLLLHNNNNNTDNGVAEWGGCCCTNHHAVVVVSTTIQLPISTTPTMDDLSSKRNGP